MDTYIYIQYEYEEFEPVESDSPGPAFEFINNFVELKCNKLV